MNKIPDLMNLLRPQPGTAGRLGQPQNDAAGGLKSAPGLVSQPGEDVSLRSPFQVAMRSLADSVYKNLPFSPQQTASSEAPVEENTGGFDYELVATNVTSYIEKAVNQARERGESDEYLEDMMAQARIGVDQGFGEARDELEDMGMMSEELGNGIDKSYDLIQQRLGEFEKELFAGDEVALSSPQVEVTRSSSTESYSSGGDFSGAQLVGQAASYRVENSASLELFTKEGDKIAISFNALQASSMGMGYASNDNGEALISSYSNESSFGFSFSVEGDLSEEEMAAITDFINQVAGVADSFFAGDFDAAFDKANELGFDDSQIASFSMSLEQTQTIAAAKVYQQVQDQPATTQPGAGASSLYDIMEPLSEYIKQFKELIEQSESIFAESTEKSTAAIDQVAEKILPFLQPEQQDAANRFQEFNQRLLQALEQLEAPVQAPLE
ncbi:hypothetical protein EZV61_03690 [Corallincola luteus]|uniref:DUF5610 domain-containing protein n=1 Tax=Corallincola luteus TaxID=1775177 RepID=A0ABY2APE7_9GAMM|nr:DUF5610 domain-containing protein [Corallincola luteus]TCI05073.1 hypothetical protein EZV61_03690 [Corallincola luteus]